MKTKIFLGCMMTASLLTVSCADLLQEDPQGKLTPENYFSTQEELNMSVYSLYSKVNASQTRTNPQYPQWQGDDITTNPGSNKQAAAEIDRFAPVNSNKGVKDCWADHYAIIKAANFIILNASKTPTDETSMKQAIGQAKFWRAYAYFMLVRIFGDIPLTLDNENDDFTMTPSPVEKVYEQIVADLTSEECESLPESYNSLIPELLDMVDKKKIAFNPAVELSYLDESQQRDFLEAMNDTQNAPSLSQAQRLKKLAQEGHFSYDVAFAVMGEEKKDELDKVVIKNDTLRKYFPRSYTPKQMEDTIIKLLDQWQRKQQRQNER